MGSSVRETLTTKDVVYNRQVGFSYPTPKTGYHMEEVNSASASVLSPWTMTSTSWCQGSSMSISRVIKVACLQTKACLGSVSFCLSQVLGYWTLLSCSSCYSEVFCGLISLNPPCTGLQAIVSPLISFLLKKGSVFDVLIIGTCPSSLRGAKNQLLLRASRWIETTLGWGAEHLTRRWDLETEGLSRTG